MSELKKKAKKDPNAPKKGTTAFMAFSTARRESIKASLPPGATFGEVAKAVGAAWGALDAEGKAPWEAKAREDAERYKREMAAYTAAGTGGGEGEGA